MCCGNRNGVGVGVTPCLKPTHPPTAALPWVWVWVSGRGMGVCGCADFGQGLLVCWQPTFTACWTEEPPWRATVLCRGRRQHEHQGLRVTRLHPPPTRQKVVQRATAGYAWRRLACWRLRMVAAMALQWLWMAAGHDCRCRHLLWRLKAPFAGWCAAGRWAARLWGSAHRCCCGDSTTAHEMVATRTVGLRPPCQRVRPWLMWPLGIGTHSLSAAVAPSSPAALHGRVRLVCQSLGRAPAGAV
jgi:hypothetical protein